MKKFAIASLLASLVLSSLTGLVSPKVEAASPNLIANPTVESVNSSTQLPTNWTSSAWGTNDAAFAYNSTGGYNGPHDLSIQIKNYTNGDAKWYFDPVTVSPNSRYVFSDYYRSTVSTELIAALTDTQGQVTYQDLGPVNASLTWQRSAAYVSTAANTSKVTVYHTLQRAGVLVTDNFSLSQAQNAVVTYNIGNNSLEQVDDLNPNLPLGWQTGSWGNNTAQFSYVSGGANDGNRSAKVTLSNYQSGDAKWYFNPVALTPNTKYVFADYYKANIPSTVVAQITHTDGSINYLTLGTMPASTTNWRRAAVYLTTPADTKSVTVLHLIAANGWLQTDNYGFWPAWAVPMVNGVPNGSLESPSDLDPFGRALAWNTGGWGTNTAQFSYLGTGQDGNHSVNVKITSYTDGDAKWYADPVAVTPNTTYQVGDWYQSNVTTHVTLMVTHTDGSLSYLQLAPASASSTWAQYSDQFTTPADVASISILHLLSSVGSLTTDHYSLTPVTPVGLTRPLVSVTFDDGWESIYKNGLPQLLSHHINSTQFIITGVLNNDPEYMTLDQVKTMNADGQEIGSHTVSHPDLTTLTPTQLQHELTDSKSFLETNLGVPVTDFATPYGSYNNTVMSAIKSIYGSQRGVEMGYNAANTTNVYDLKVQDITSTTTVSDIQSWLAEAKATNTWLILVYHGVDTSGDAYNVTPTQLGAQLDAIVASGLPTVTIHQGLTEIQPQLK